MAKHWQGLSADTRERLGLRPLRICRECGRVFDMLNETDVAEWHYGHDCEV